MKVYFSTPLSTDQVREDSKNYYKELIENIPADISVIYPDTDIIYVHNEYISSDLINLSTSDVLVVYSPFAAIGVSMELAIFKTLKPMNPAICFKCIKHPWLLHFTNYHLDDIIDVAIVISNIYKNVSVT